MPFVQMENISHFLHACQLPPLGLPPHDVFLTVDLYEAKDPAQVLQCISAFSRRANAIQPNRFPRTIGIKSRAGALSPHLTGSSSGGRVVSPARDTTSRPSSPAKSPKPIISSWSKMSDEQATMPAWNIHQYGYMGGASQGNQGISFGARRQITSQAPAVPSLAEKEKRRRDEQEKLQQAEENERVRQIDRDAEEERARAEEERRWEEEAARLREKERLRMIEERRQWEEEQRRWEDEETRRFAEEKEAENRLEKERQVRRDTGDSRLNGQFLSQYQASKAAKPTAGVSSELKESQRIKELERELERAKERERQYERERQELLRQENSRSRSRPQSHSNPSPPVVPVKPSYDLASMEQERRLLRNEWQKRHDANDDFAEEAPSTPPRPLPEPATAATNPPQKPPRPLPQPQSSHPTQAGTNAAFRPPNSPRPLPSPSTATANTSMSRVDRFLASNIAPVTARPSVHRPEDYSSTAEIDKEESRRIASQQKTRAGGWASKSLLEREMERERERQREWEENQKQTRDTAQKGLQDSTLGTGPGQGAWDVHQYGYMGGDNQNRGGLGLGVSGARRQIIGPRPPP